MPVGLGAFAGCLLPVGGRTCTVVSRLGSIGGRPRSVTARPQQDVLPTRVLVLLQIVQASQLVTTLRATVANRGSPITLFGRL